MESSTTAAGHLPAGDGVREAVARYAGAWAAGDRAGVVASYHDDFTLHYFGGNPLAGMHRGKQAALATLAEVTRQQEAGILATMRDVGTLQSITYMGVSQAGWDSYDVKFAKGSFNVKIVLDPGGKITGMWTTVPP